MVPRVGPFEPFSGPAPEPSPEATFPEARVLVMLAELPVDKKVKLSVEFLDRGGNPTLVDGVPAWTVDNNTVLSVTPSADGMSVECVPVGPLSETPVTVGVSADADLGAGVETIYGIFVIERITSGQATTVAITSGPLEPVTP